MSKHFNKRLDDYAENLKNKYLEKQKNTKRIIMHVDVNSAYLSWTALKILKNQDLDIRNIPSVISHSSTSRKSIVLAKSILAKNYGVKTGEILADSLRKCPNLKVFKPDFKLYENMSHSLVNILSKYTYYVEKYSIDECFLDVTDFLFKQTPENLAKNIKEDIFNTLGFTVNIGIGNSKVMAKTASDFEKPNKIHTLYNSEIKSKLWPLDISNLFMMGKKSREKLYKIGIKTIGDLANAKFSEISHLLGKNGESLWKHANGIDNSKVLHEKEKIKSISNSETFPKDLNTKEDISREIIKIALKVIDRMQEEKFYAKTITLELRTYDFVNFGKSITLSKYTNLSNEIIDIIKNCLQNIYFDFLENKSENFNKLKDKKLNPKILQINGEIKPLRLVGVRLSNLKYKNEIENSIFDILNTKEKKYKEKNEALDKAINNINKKYGLNFITRARNINTKDNKKNRN